MHSICLRFNGGTFVHTVNTVPHKWGESPSPLKHFNIYVQLSLHTFLPCMRSVEKQSEERESTWGGELGQYLYKCPSENGQCWIPCSLVVASVPQILQCMSTARCRDLLYTNHTVLILQQTAVCLQHMSDLYIIWFKVKKKIKKLFRMSMYELEF